MLELTQKWKIIISLTFWFSLISCIILMDIDIPKYEYKTKIFYLDDSYIFYVPEDGRIADYICDKNIYVNKGLLGVNIFMSTSRGSYDVKEKYKGTLGTCMIEIKRRIK